MFSLGEFVGGPYSNDPTVKTLGSRGVYNKFHAHFFTNKVPQVVLQFSWIGTHLGGKGTNVPHVPGTAAPLGTVGLAGAAGLAGGADLARCSRTYPVPRLRSQSLPSEDHVSFEDRWMVASLCDE
jgi:hypothetical protein